MNRPAARLVAAVVALAAIAGAGALAWALPAPLPQLSPQIAARQPDVAHGAYLAIAGDCTACHTRPGGPAFGGGVAFHLPMGTIYSPNITSDARRGMGAYTLPEFIRMMRQGVGRDGRRIYPAMPYTAFTKASDADLQDVWAYFKTVPASDEARRPGTILWPLSIRWPLAFWNKLFLDDTRFQPPAGASAQVARGAYLVEGFGHCGTCHTPRGPFIAEKATKNDSPLFLSGAELDGQSASNLRGDPATGLGRWRTQDVVELLKTARTAHAAVSGQMSEVVEHSTQWMSDDDLDAIAAYLKTLSPAGERSSYAASPVTYRAMLAGKATDRGARIYMDSCSACHKWDGAGWDHAFPSLAGNATVLHPSPDSLVTAIVAGARLPSTQGAPSAMAMPAFGWRYSDREIAELATFVRNAWGNHAPAVTAGQVRRIRKLALDKARQR